MVFIFLGHFVWCPGDSDPKSKNILYLAAIVIREHYDVYNYFRCSQFTSSVFTKPYFLPTGFGGLSLYNWKSLCRKTSWCIICPWTCYNSKIDMSYVRGFALRTFRGHAMFCKVGRYHSNPMLSFAWGDAQRLKYESMFSIGPSWQPTYHFGLML